MKQRLKAIACCLKFGLLPWWAYEKAPHYNCSYWQHLLINMGYASRWLTFQEDETDRQFEDETNPLTPNSTPNKMKLAIKTQELPTPGYIAHVDWEQGDGEVGTPGAVKYGDTPAEAYQALKVCLEGKGHAVLSA